MQMELMRNHFCEYWKHFLLIYHSKVGAKHFGKFCLWFWSCIVIFAVEQSKITWKLFMHVMGSSIEIAHKNDHLYFSVSCSSTCIYSESGGQSDANLYIWFAFTWKLKQNSNITFSLKVHMISTFAIHQAHKPQLWEECFCVFREIC